ncbi:MAG: DNA recombination protein RmuC [Phycisphaerae bacterium]
MEYVFFVVLSLLLAAILVLLLVRRRGGESPVEAQLRDRINALEAESQELRQRLEIEYGTRVEAETRLEAERKNLAEQRALLAEAEVKLKDAFAALSAEALKESRQEFLGQAEERLKPIRDLLAEYQKRLGEIEKAREGAYGGLDQHLKGLGEAQQLLRKEAHQLATALRNPAARGRWGELQLRRVLEMAGMSSYCDFGEQETQKTEEGYQRPDVTVKLPNDRRIPVDSKVPLDAYFEAYQASDEKAVEAALDRHAQAVRNHVRSLSGKEYWKQFKKAPDFVVLFLPEESSFAAALKTDPKLFEEAIEKGVVITTPMTLYALLRAVAAGWRENQLAENAQRVGEAGRELYDRICIFAGHFAGVGDGLTRAVEAYRDAKRSYESRLEPGARKLAELGASSGKELPGVETVEGPTRALPEGET